MIDGIGVDIIEIERVDRAIRNPRFVERIFSPAEVEYCGQSVRAERYAGRFAAKEAVAKAFGRALCWHDVEILPQKGGAPLVRLSGEAAELLGGRRIMVSISHCHAYAVAQAVLFSGAAASVVEPPLDL